MMGPSTQLPDQIETERLIVRRYRSGDGRAYAEMCLANRDHLLPFEAGNPALSVNSEEAAESLVREFATAWDARRFFLWGAWRKAGGAFACQVTVSPVSWDLPEFEIGYFVDGRCQGEGFVTEAVFAVITFCFEHLRAHRLRLACNELNVRSWRVAERCGFTREGYLRQTHRDLLRDDGLPSGDYLYGLLRDGYARDVMRV